MSRRCPSSSASLSVPDRGSAPRSGASVTLILSLRLAQFPEDERYGDTIDMSIYKKLIVINNIKLY